MKRYLNCSTSGGRWRVGLLTALTLYAGVGFLIVPGLIRQYAPAFLSDAIQRSVTLQSIRFNPFLLALEAQDVTLHETDGTSILNAGRILVDLNAVASLIRPGLTLDELRLERATLHLIQTTSGKLNLNQLQEDINAASPPKADAPPLALSLKQLVIAEGAITLTDDSRPSALPLSLEHLNLTLNGLSTLPNRESAFFIIQAGSPEQGTLSGQGALTGSPLSSSGSLDIKGLGVAPLWELIRDQLAISPPEGELDLSADYRFSLIDGQRQFRLNQGILQLKALKLSDARRQPLLQLEDITLDGLEADLSGQVLSLTSASLRRGGLRVQQDENGQLNWQNLILPSAADSAPPQGASTPATPWKVELGQLDIEGLRLDYANPHGKTPVSASVADLSMTLKASVEAGGPSSRGHLETLRLQLNGITLNQSENPIPLLALDAVRMTNGGMDLEDKTIGFETLEIQGGHAAITRTSTGELHPFDLITNPQDAPASRQDTAPASSPAASPRWRASLNQASLQGFDLAWTDQSYSPALNLDLDDIRITAQSLSNQGNAPIRFESALNIRQGGTLTLTGNALPDTLKLQADITLEHMNAGPLRPIISQFAALQLEEGELSTHLAVSYRGQQISGPSVQITGDARIGHLKLVQDKEKRKFLAWKDLDASGIDFRLEPDSLAIKTLRLTEPDSVITIYEDKSTNLNAILKSRHAPPPPRGPSREDSAVTQPLPITIDRVVIDNGRMDFSDASLLMPFATRIDNVGGSITGFGSGPQNRAKLKLTGAIDRYGEMVANGSLAPLDMTGFSDFSILFENVEMTALSPYSATFAGRKIESGKMNLDLKYTIEHHQLQSESHLVLDRFALGETVPSPHASSLPLDFAISLLTDSDGKIRVSVPMSGHVGKAGFSYGDMVLDAIGTMVKNLATAPFSALGSLLGEEADQMGLIAFDPGHSSIPPHEREKLARLAEALASREKLQLLIHGRYDKQLDTAALQALQLRREVADLMDIELKPDEVPDELNFTHANTQRALEKLARRQGDLADEVKERYEQAAGHPPSRIGLLGKASSTPDFYEQLYAALVQRVPVANAALETLAIQRSQALLANLSKRGRFDARHMSAGHIEAQESAPDERHVKSRLELLAK